MRESAISGKGKIQMPTRNHNCLPLYTIPFVGIDQYGEAGFLILVHCVCFLPWLHPSLPIFAFKSGLFPLEALRRELQRPAVLRDRANYMVRGA